MLCKHDGTCFINALIGFAKSLKIGLLKSQMKVAGIQESDL